MKLSDIKNLDLSFDRSNNQGQINRSQMINNILSQSLDFYR